jgi:hypothetical protein
MQQILASIFPDQYITLITALCSGLVGGSVALVSVYLTNQANAARLKLQIESEARQRKNELLRERGEELYELFNNWMNSFIGFYLRRNAVIQGKLTLNESFELDVKIGKEYPVNFGRMKMLIDVYFPSVRPGYDTVEKRRQELISIEIEHGHAYDSGDTDGERFLKPFINCQKNFEKAGEDLKLQIIEVIRAI